MATQDFKGTLNGLTHTAATTGFTIAGGTASKTLTVSATTSLDEAVAMSSKAPKTSVIGGDGTAGRVLRAIYIHIENGTDATTIKPSSISVWNGDASGAEDNLGKGGNTGVFSLSADGSQLIMNNSGISGDLVGVLATSPRYNFSNVNLIIDHITMTNGITLLFTNQAGAVQDLTTLVDTGQIQIQVLYLTSA
jgi:hypothetical protein